MIAGRKQLWTGDHSQKHMLGDHENDEPMALKKTAGTNWMQVTIYSTKWKKLEEASSGYKPKSFQRIQQSLVIWLKSVCDIYSFDTNPCGSGVSPLVQCWFLQYFQSKIKLKQTF